MSTEIHSEDIKTQQQASGRDQAAAPVVNEQPVKIWKPYQKVLFRIAFVFFVLMSIPMTGEWYKNLVGINWLHLHYRDLYDIARFQPSLVRFQTPAYYLMGYADWLAVLGIGIVGGLVWTAIDRGKTKNYQTLYYWLRVIVRYRAGIGIIGFGFTKLFPVQLPYPSLGLLNTNFGDLTAQKIYWLSIGIVPWYQVFAGVVEVLAGALLFFRKTTLLGAILLFGALGDITFVNFSYDGGVHVYASYFVLFAAFLMIYDVPKLYNLLILERYTVSNNFYPVISQKWLKYTRVTLKVATIWIFLVVLFYIQYINFKYDPYKQPAAKGVKELRGNYNVTTFKINNQEIPYSPLDSVRWSEATFENWSTLTFKVNKPVPLDLSNGGGSPMRDINRTFELTGVAGGQRVFYYQADTVNHVLYLQDKYVAANRRNKGKSAKQEAKGKKSKGDKKDWIPKEALAHIQDEYASIDPVARSTRRERGIPEELKDKRKRNHMILNYSTTDGNHIVLTGVNERKDSIYVVLDKVNRQYALKDSKLQAGKY
ncbi:hypothetical protein [Mucilaginibacter aquaedulcis]|uniref:hypothetical protein n=1 Tax=Mucilaginibacter aquaedulcis TaxID=1187081 RepID=UPI0025B5939A|nr:hypothetical protein [Mucilaginibacter aquaedulcis]MDN3547651.1 hypothetical protein [Mucilaginibacter aquaedulcis]